MATMLSRAELQELKNFIKDLINEIDENEGIKAKR